MGQADFAQEIMEDFLESTNSSLDNLQSLAEQDDLANLRIQAHRLKGTSATVAAVELAEILLELENFLSTGSAPPSQLSRQQACKLLEEARTEMQRVRSYYRTSFADALRSCCDCSDAI